MKKILVCFVLFFIPLCNVKANSISSINMDIHIDKNGNATVIEKWDANVTEGVEGYHPYYNLGEAKITNFVVNMDGYLFENINWNFNDSFSEKAYKSGIYYNASNNEYDLCFGISNYGRHTYILKYIIEGFVVSLNDADMIYWNLFPKEFKISPNSVNIVIESDINFDTNLPVWGYGKYGAPTYVRDNKIIMSSNNKKVLENEYLTLLVKFSRNSFNTNVNINQNFDYYLNMANKQSKVYKYSQYYKYLIGIPVVGMIILLIITLFKSKSSYRVISYKLANLDFEKNGKIKNNEVIPYRDIPFNGDIFKSFFLIHFYDSSNNDKNILSAFLLRWINKGYIKLEKIDDKIESIIFSDFNVSNNEFEKRLYSFFKIASMSNGKSNNEYKLEVLEFEKWCRENGHLISDWFCDVLEFEMDKLISEKKIIIERVPNGESYGLKYNIESSLKNDALIVLGLKRFLEEFTIINERQPIEVKLFNDYLIYASMFGIADKVATKFREFYPEFVANTNFDFDNFNFVSNIVSNDISFSANYSKNSGQFDSMVRDASNYGSFDAGGGGFSSGGGGGGSFGSGGGGGGFR